MNFNRFIWDKYFLLILSIICLFSCENIKPAVFIEELSVIALLQQGTEVQKVYLYKTIEDIDSNVDNEMLFVKNAKVKISDNEYDYEFTYTFNDSLGKSVYINKDKIFKFIPNREYRLNINSNIGEVCGITFIPDSVVIISPTTNDSVIKNTDLEIKWKDGEFSYGYIVNVFGPPYEFDNNLGQVYNMRDMKSFHTTENSYTILGHNINYCNSTTEKQYLEEKQRYTIIVMALDANFKYHLFDGDDIAGISNGWGLFGSTTIDSIDIFVFKN